MKFLPIGTLVGIALITCIPTEVSAPTHPVDSSALQKSPEFNSIANQNPNPFPRKTMKKISSVTDLRQTADTIG